MIEKQFLHLPPLSEYPGHTIAGIATSALPECLGQMIPEYSLNESAPLDLRIGAISLPKGSKYISSNSGYFLCEKIAKMERFIRLRINPVQGTNRDETRKASGFPEA